MNERELIEYVKAELGYIWTNFTLARNERLKDLNTLVQAWQPTTPDQAAIEQAHREQLAQQLGMFSDGDTDLDGIVTVVFCDPAGHKEA